MSENDRIILQTIIEENRKELAPEIPTASDYFEIFAAEQILKHSDISDEELLSGMVGAGGDGGIDSIHVFVNGNLVQDDTDISGYGRDVNIEIHIIQTKLETGFTESTIQRFDTTFGELFDLSRSLDQFESVYNEDLLKIVGKFREIYTKYASKLPKLIINFSYVTLGDEVHPNVGRLVAKLRSTVLSLFSSAQFLFTFIGAKELLQIARQAPKTSFPLRLAENPMAPGEEKFICLVNLPDFYNFICDTEGHLLKRIFEANVRDYQGNIQVNQEIQKTLRNPSGDDFWWLNNGITMIASKASLSGRILTIENPLIVNGMQTSYEIYKCFSEDSSKTDPRNILVRVIGTAGTPNETESQNRIIKATNSQTAIQTASFRATDEIQYNIEDYLKSQGFYYDRRKNYYKSERKPLNKIISITYLAQSVISIVLRRPNDARARPSTLLKEDKDYQSIFNPDYPMPIYLQCIKIMKHIESYLRTNFPEFTSTEVINYKFHLAMFSSLLIANNPEATIDDILKINLDDLTTDLLDNCFSEVNSIYSKLKMGSYFASKSSDAVKKLSQRLKKITYKA